MINLLPPETKRNVHYGKMNVTLIQYAILVVVISLALSAILIFGVTIVSSDESALRDTIKTKEEQLAKLADSENEANELADTIDTISALIRTEVSFSELLQEIGSVIPNGASLTNLQLTGDETQPLQIVATIDTQAKAAVLRENLAASDLFRLADIQSINTGEADENGDPMNYTTTISVQFTDSAPIPLPSDETAEEPST